MYSSLNYLVFVSIISCVYVSTKNIKNDRFHPSHEGYSIKSQSAMNGFQSPWLDTDWNAMGRNSIMQTKDMLDKIVNSKAKNVIMFIGDGMGLATVAAARVYNSQLNNLKREDIYMSWEKFPFASLSRTYNVDRVTPDSAGTATAYLSGVKANTGTIGVNANVPRYNCTAVKGNEALSISKYSNQIGKWSGLITTTRVTHASPAGCYAHVGDRDWEAYVSDSVEGKEQCEDIALQLVTSPDTQNMRVILGGGYQNFIPNNQTDPEFGSGKRKDGRNLTDEWLTTRQNGSVNDNVKFVRNKSDFDKIDPKLTDYLMGLFSGSYMDFEADRDPQVQPSLSEMTKKAIEILSKNENGYFLFVEGGKIDLAHHDTVAYKALNDTMALSQAVQLAFEMTNPDETLIVVTSDHSHTFSVGGYGSFSESIFGFADDGWLANDDKPFLQLSYINGPGYQKNRQDSSGAEMPRKNLTYADNLDDKDFEQDTGVWLDSETHGGEDVAIYATGPMAYLFQSTCEQSYIAHVMMYASCVGQYTAETHCTSGSGQFQGWSGAYLILVAVVTCIGADF